MKLNNKGITLVEIIISVALISIILIFLFSLLIQVNNENSDNEVKSSYLVNQATFIKQIEEDFLDYGEGFKEGSYCTESTISATTPDASLYLPKLYGASVSLTGDAQTMNIKCLNFKYNDDSNSYLFLYKREDTSNENGYVTILSYYRGDFKQSVELEEFDWNMNVIRGTTEQLSASASSNSTYKEFTFSLPIIGPDEKDYSINLSYYKP